MNKVNIKDDSAKIRDGLQNIAANLGTESSKAGQSRYVPRFHSEQSLDVMYRASPLARKIVNITTNDATKFWRAWKAESDEITKIEDLEKRLSVKRQVVKAQKWAQKYGGAAILIGEKGANIATPLDPEKITSLDYLTVLKHYDLTPDTQYSITDLSSPFFGEPAYFTFTREGVVRRIHRTRLAIFNNDGQIGKDYWGDSILSSVEQALLNFDSTAQNLAEMVYEAAVDVIKIPDLSQGLIGDENGEYERSVLQRLRLAKQGMYNSRILAMDMGEEYLQKTINFSGVADVLDKMKSVVSAYTDIPETRLFGRSPSGLNSTGEGDERNYHSNVLAIQENMIEPALYVLDACLVKVALGGVKPHIFYNWRPLDRNSDADTATIGLKTAQTAKILIGLNGMPPEAVLKSVVNTLTENGAMVGLEPEFGRLFDPNDITKSVATEPDPTIEAPLEEPAQNGVDP